VIAVADCYLTRCEEAATKRKANWAMYQDHRKLLENKDIDAVIVATQDHCRAIPCIHACQAGKDVYAEKPMTLYIGEGRAIVNAARKHKRVFQVGSQQRSMKKNEISCGLVRDGKLGKLKLVQGVNYPSSKPVPAYPEEPIPEKLNWDVWLGQAPMRPYSKQIQTKWMPWSDYSGGEMTNWGAHGLDQVQWALGTDTTGPVELWPMQDGPDAPIAFRYANGVEVHLDLPYATNKDLYGGARFIGEKGKIDIWRNAFKLDAGDLTVELPPQEEIDKWQNSRARWQARYHMETWLECIRTRQKPNADVEIGHRSVSLCHLANITRTLQRRLRWDPKTEKFAGNAEANRMVHRERRKGWELPKV
jgi:predicted dehydrogenase